MRQLPRMRLLFFKQALEKHPVVVAADPRPMARGIEIQLDQLHLEHIIGLKQ